jgi:hypothetical protein
MSKVLGVGWAKTGTTTLGDCLETLGYSHRRADLSLVAGLATGDLDAIFDVADAHDSFEDWPWLLLFKEFDQRYPGSKFILTTRDEESWLRSYRNMLANQGQASAQMNQTRRTLYGLDFPHVTDDQLVERYRRHHREVREYFAGRPDDLLEVNWQAGDGWEQLCGFLGHAVPDLPFPQANKGTYAPQPRHRLLSLVDRLKR